MASTDVVVIGGGIAGLSVLAGLCGGSPGSPAAPRVDPAPSDPHLYTCSPRPGPEPMLEIANLEVVYNEVILVLRPWSREP